MITIDKQELIKRLAIIGRTIAKDERVSLLTVSHFLAGAAEAFPELDVKDMQEVSHGIFS